MPAPPPCWCSFGGNLSKVVTSTAILHKVYDEIPLYMFEQAFKNIDDVLWKEAGCTTELDYTEQSSWLLFLKYLDGLEQDKSTEAQLEGKKYAFILDAPYRWETWAAPKDKDGKIDHNKAKTGDDLRDFVNQKLFPYLHGFKLKATGPDTIEYKIGEIFGEIKNKIQSGYNLRETRTHGGTGSPQFPSRTGADTFKDGTIRTSPLSGCCSPSPLGNSVSS